MKRKNLIPISIALISTLGFSSCLQTRGDVGADEQSQVYGKKAAAQQQESQLNQKAAQSAPVDERDDLIRALNGRVEGLENQISNLKQEKSAASSQDAQKIAMLQDALTKMETQIQSLQADQIKAKAQQEANAVAAAQAAKEKEEASTKVVKKGGKVSSEKSANTYEVAQGLFANHEWKKAILNYQKYVDEAPKGKEVSDAKYKIGVCFQELGMKEEAQAFFEEVVANYGKTDAGKKAKIRLAKLKK